jgi:hypothetical protein
VVFYAILALGVHFVMKILIYVAFGISFCYINPFNLSIHGIQYTSTESNDVCVKIKKVKLGYSLFSRSMASFRVSVLDVTVNFAKLDLETSFDSLNTGDQSTNTHDGHKLFEKMKNEGFNPDAPVSLYAGDKKLRRLSWFVLKYLPHISFKIYNTRLLLGSEYEVVLTIMEGQTEVSDTNREVSLLKKSNNSIHTLTSSIHANDGHLLRMDTGGIVTKFFDQCVASFILGVDVKTGVIESLEPTFRLAGIEVSVLYLLRILKSINPSFTLINTKKYDTLDTDIERVQILPKYRFFIYGLLVRMLKNASITLQSITITDIPAGKPEKVEKYLQSNSVEDLENIIFVTSNVNTLTLNVGPISPNQVGYSLKFVENSFPIQWLITIAGFKMSLDFSKMKGYSGEAKAFDIIYIPNLLFTMESTMMVNLLRVIFNNDVQEDFVKTQTLTTVQFTVANPSIDISIEQLILLIKTFTITRSAEADDDELFSEDKRESLNEREKTRKKKYVNAFLETLPKFQIRFLIEKPMAIVRSDTGLQRGRDLHMVILQPSLIGIHLNSSTIKKRMRCDFRIDIPETSLVYQRNNENQSSVTLVSLRDFQLKSSCKLLKFDNVKLAVTVDSLSVDMTNMEALNGIGIILNSLKLHMCKHNAPKRRIREPIKNRDENLRDMFKELPSWFSMLTIDLKSMALILGSKSLFLPPEILLAETEVFNKVSDDGCHAPSKVKFKVQEISFSLKQKDTSLDVHDTTSTEASDKSKAPDDYHWSIPGKIKGIHIQTFMQNPNFDIRQTEKILSIPNIDLNCYCLKNNTFEISSAIDLVNIDHSISSHFTLFSAFYLLKTSLSFHRGEMFPELLRPEEIDHKDLGHDAVAHKRRSTDGLPELPNVEKKFTLVNIKWNVREILFKMQMPGMFKLRLDMFDMKGLAAKNSIVMEKKLIRLSIQKSAHHTYYNRVLSLDNMRVVCQLPDAKHKIASISIFDSNVNITIPSNFVVHSLFDAVVLTAKLTQKFVKTIKNGPSSERDKITSSGVVNLPKIALKAPSLSMKLEDDPFEVNLGMIYQLGLLEQNVRLEKYRIFEELKERVKEETPSVFDEKTFTEVCYHLDNIEQLADISGCQIENIQAKEIVDECAKKYHKLRVNISKSWIKTIGEYKLKKRSTLDENMSFLTGVLSSALPVSKAFNSNIVDSDENPPLMGILLNDVMISVKPPKFKRDNGDVHEYLYRVGKGVPKDSVWDKIVPMGITMKAAEVRVHLRDFPLPLAYIPNSNACERWSDSFVLKATLVIAEVMPTTDNEYWYLYVPMFNDMSHGGDTDRYYSWEAPKTITSVKTYYEADCDINSDTSTMGTWSTAYQDVLRQLNLTFDTFSKVTMDPSPKLGTWDKLRNILHGYVRMRWTNRNSDVRINILNSSDPYKIMGYNAGFSLLFKNDVEWLINDPDRELERDYFIFRSKNIIFGVPNFLAEPLPCWCSRSLVFMPAGNADSLVSSLFGYYLNTHLYLDKNADAQRIYQDTKEFRFKTANICLNGDIELKFSMTFERIVGDGKTTRKFKSHFENILSRPGAVKDISSFDSYRGFRSDYIHMALNLKTRNSTLNVLRLTPIALSWFIKWFKRFSDDPSLPIRNGSLWDSVVESVKMGTHVMTFKFKFDVSPLYIYFGHRSDLSKPDNLTSIGLKAKIGSFKCDLHERKEKKVKKIEFLNQSYEIMHMCFYIGKVDLVDIDLRVIGLKFEKVSDGIPKHKFQIFDNDESWIDTLDFEEMSLPSLKNANINGQIHPLLHASHFSYWMNRNLPNHEGVGDLGNEESHDCLVREEEFPDIPYNHIFDVNSLKLKWNCGVRNLIFEFLFEIDFRSAYIYGTSFRAARAIYEKIESTKRNKNAEPKSTQRKIADIEINNHEDFENMMNDVGGLSSSATAVNDMLIRLDDVQAQLMIEPDDDSLILMRTQHNEIRIVSIMDEDWYKYIETAFICKRIGTILENADLLIMTKEEYGQLGQAASHYGTTGTWPVFLTGDEPVSFVKEKTLLSDVLIYFGYEKAYNSYSARKSRDKLYLNVPKFETKIDSHSYFTSFKIVNQLLIYSSQQQKQFAQMIQAISLATGDNIDHMYDTLEKICGEVHSIVKVHQALSPYRYVMNEEPMVDLLMKQELSKHFTNALLLSKTLLLACDPEEGGGDDDCFLEWIIRATNVNIDFIECGESFLSFTLNDSIFSRLEMLDKSSHNQISINEIEIINRDYDILYPVLLTSYSLDKKVCGVNVPNMKEVIKIKWELGEKVGGMPLIKDVNIMCHPMKLSIEEKTGFKLMKFLFPNEVQYQMNRVSSSDDDEPTSLFDDVEENDDDYDDVSDGDDDAYYDGGSDSATSDAGISDSGNMSLVTGRVIEMNDDENVSSVMKVPNTAETTEDKVPNQSSNPNIRLNHNNESSGNGLDDQLKPANEIKYVSSNMSITSKTANSVKSQYSSRLNKRITKGNHINTQAALDNLLKFGIKTSAYEMADNAEEMLEISERAKMYFTINKLVFHDCVLNITFSGAGKFRLMNVNDLLLTVPRFAVVRKIWSSIDLINAIKKHFIKTILKQSGRLLKNKLFVFRRKKRVNRLGRHKKSRI